MGFIHISTFKYSSSKSLYCSFMNSLYSNIWFNIKKYHHFKHIIKCIMKGTHRTSHNKMFIWSNISVQSANLFFPRIHLCIWTICILFPNIIIHIKI